MPVGVRMPTSALTPINSLSNGTAFETVSNDLHMHAENYELQQNILFSEDNSLFYKAINWKNQLYVLL